MTRLEVAEMRFLRSVKGYTRLDKTRSEVIRKNWRSLEYKMYEPNTNKIGLTTLREWIATDCRNTLSTTNTEDEEIVDASGNDGKTSMAEQVKRHTPCRKKMIMMMTTLHKQKRLLFFSTILIDCLFYGRTPVLCKVGNEVLYTA